MFSDSWKYQCADEMSRGELIKMINSSDFLLWPCLSHFTPDAFGAYSNPVIWAGQRLIKDKFLFFGRMVFLVVVISMGVLWWREGSFEVTHSLPFALLAVILLVFNWCFYIWCRWKREDYNYFIACIQWLETYEEVLGSCLSDKFFDLLKITKSDFQTKFNQKVESVADSLVKVCLDIGNENNFLLLTSTHHIFLSGKIKEFEEIIFFGLNSNLHVLTLNAYFEQALERLKVAADQEFPNSVTDQDRDRGEPIEISW